MKTVSNIAFGRLNFERPLHIAAAILLVTAAAKLVMITGNTHILATKNPLFESLTRREAIAVAALLEIIVGAVLLSQSKECIKAVSLLALCTSFWTYRFGLWWIGASGTCACLGALADIFKLSPRSVDVTSMLILAYFTVLSGLALLVRSDSHRSCTTIPLNTPP